MTETAASTAPGWYPDPWDAADLRWWDGAEWTGHTSEHATKPASEIAAESASEPESTTVDPYELVASRHRRVTFEFSPILAMIAAVAAIPLGLRGLHMAWGNRYPLGYLLAGAGILIGIGSLGVI